MAARRDALVGRADNLAVIGQLLDAVGTPAHDARDGEQRRKQLRRDAQQTVQHTRVEIHVRADTLVHLAVLLDDPRPDPLDHEVQVHLVRRPLLGREFLHIVAQDNRARVGHGIDRMTDAVNQPRAVERLFLDELEEVLDINYDEGDPLIEKIDVLIQQLESNEGYMQNELNRQYIITAKAINAYNKKESLKNIWAMSHEAIKISIPGFDEDLIEDYYLSRVDMLILTLMVALYSDAKDHDKAIGVLYGIKRNLDKHCIDKDEMGKRYPVIIANLSYLLLYEVKRYSEAVEVCESGRKVCIETGRIFYLPVIVGYMAICLCKLGDTAKGKKLLRQAYHACDLIEMYQCRDELGEFAKNELSMDLERGAL